MNDHAISMAGLIRRIHDHADDIGEDHERLSQFGFALCSIGAAIITQADGADAARASLHSMSVLAAAAEHESWDDEFEDFDDE
jgi:hypothetical protein